MFRTKVAIGKTEKIRASFKKIKLVIENIMVIGDEKTGLFFFHLEIRQYGVFEGELDRI